MDIIIHRGTHEIGGSCIELKVAEARLILDLGQPIASALAELDGLALSTEDALAQGLLPAIPGLYRGQEGPRPLAVVLSHLHQDHAGLIHHIHPEVPVYLGDRASGLYRAVAPIVRFAPLGDLNVQTYRNQKGIELGPFRVVPHLMDHTAFDAYGLEISGGGKKVYYSGDFRGHGRKRSLFAKFCRRPPQDVDVLLMEGTTLGRSERSQTLETDLEEDFVSHMKGNDKHALVAYSPQNLDRHVTLIRAALRSGRRFYLDAYGAWCHEAFRRLGVGLPALGRGKGEVGVLLGGESWLKKETFREFEHHLVTRVASNFASALAQPALVTHRFYLRRRLETRLEQLQGGKFFYSMWPGYLAKDKDLQPFLERAGMELHKVHTSGHADKQTLRDLLQAIKPKRLIPVHTEVPEQFQELDPTIPVTMLEDGAMFLIP